MDGCSSRPRAPVPVFPLGIPAVPLLTAWMQRFSFGSSVNPWGFFNLLTSGDLGELIESGFMSFPRSPCRPQPSLHPSSGTRSLQAQHLPCNWFSSVEVKHQRGREMETLSGRKHGAGDSGCSSLPLFICSIVMADSGAAEQPRSDPAMESSGCPSDPSRE